MTHKIISFDDTLIIDLLLQCISIAVIIGFIILSIYFSFLVIKLAHKAIIALDIWIKRNKHSSLKKNLVASALSDAAVAEDFMTPPNHINFHAKKLFSDAGQIIDGSIAYLEANGGGPLELHTHEHNHLFIIVEGEAKILLGNQEVLIKKDESLLVEGNTPHSVWNNLNSTTVIVGLSVK